MVRRMIGRQVRGGDRRVARRRNTPAAQRNQYIPNKSRMGLVMDQLITTRMYRISNISVTAANFAAGYDFQLQYLPNAAEYSALFDLYKIWKVEVQFVPKYNTSDFATGGAGFGLPTIYIAEDRNDVATPGSVAELQEYHGCIARRFDKPITYTCWPTVFQSGTIGLVVDSRQKDLFCRGTSRDIPHFGIKWAMDLPLGLETFRMDVVFKYFIMLKDCK